MEADDNSKEIDNSYIKYSIMTQIKSILIAKMIVLCKNDLINDENDYISNYKFFTCFFSTSKLVQFFKNKYIMSKPNWNEGGIGGKSNKNGLEDPVLFSTPLLFLYLHQK